MTPSAIERAARAHYETQAARHANPAGPLTRWATWDEACLAQGFLAEKVECVRAVLLAIREPTAEMLAQAKVQDVRGLPGEPLPAHGYLDNYAAEDIWRGFIDHLLEPKE